MTENKKILFTDLDGTLLDSHKQISAYTRAVLAAFAAAGNHIVLSSGRDINSVADVQREIDLFLPGMYLIGFNGGAIRDCDSGQIVYRLTMDKKDALTILRTAAVMGIYSHTYSATHIISPGMCRELKHYTDVIHTPVVYTDPSWDSLDADVYKCIAIDYGERSRLAELQERLQKSLTDVTFAASAPHLLDMFPAVSGKGAALVRLCNILNIPISDSIAAGDEENDLSMLEAAGHAIAMKNSAPALMDVADTVTEYDSDNDGLVRAIEALGMGGRLH